MNYVYMLRCRDDSLYCGWTTDLESRIVQHNAGKGAKYTRSRLPVKLVYFEMYEDRHEALSREWHLKHMKREEKLKLTEGREGKTILPDEHT
ncbi:MAG: GIY-YIG nuclease family protein [Clostridia bacterium]|nr:GIY-YIG nuclease family protein [Clostridia bacterium]